MDNKEFFKFLDSIVIGYASAVLAELVVAGLALAGVTISTGWIIIIVAILAAIIAGIILWMMDEADVSFSQKVLQGYNDLLLFATGH